ncbi:MAG TPA: class E sortase [Patescibacteria group bacterium]|nr:class E sortase [Patescibacteria group bacterium]
MIINMVYLLKKRIFAFVFLFFAGSGIAVLLYLLFLPVYPWLKYKTLYRSVPVATSSVDWQKLESDYSISFKKENKFLFQDAEHSNRIVIPRIGVDAPIIRTTNQAEGLNKGAWMLPAGSTPGEGGNTIITAHRFKYLPPNNLTFYLLDKLRPGDEVIVLWQEQGFLYRVKERKIIKKDDFSILKPSSTPILTLFTCHPLFSDQERLVILASKIKKD